jgi:magnesium-transporting ATPase (P-type)
MDNMKHEAKKQRKKIFNNFIINNLLLLTGILVIISGLSIQFGYHIGGDDGPRGHRYDIPAGFENHEQEQPVQYEKVRGIDTKKTILGLRYNSWTVLHKYVIFFFLLLMLYHVSIHWKWYKGVVSRNLIGKNKQVAILTVLFLLVVLTGLVPWFIDLSGSSMEIRLLFIELHDKLSLFLIIFIILHIVKRTKWYLSAYKKLKAYGD